MSTSLQPRQRWTRIACTSELRRVSSFPAEHEKSSGRIIMRIASIAATAGALLFAGTADAAEIQPVAPQATHGAPLGRGAQIEQAAGHKGERGVTAAANAPTV